MLRWSVRCRELAKLVGLCVVVLASAIVSVATSVRADETVALVIGIEGGASTPAIAPFSEIAAGASVALPARVRLTFMHYHRCEQVTVESGTITFGSDRYRVVGGSIVSSQYRPCPRTGLDEPGQVGGIRLRGEPAVVASPMPTFVLTGPAVGAVARVRIMSAEQQLADAPVTSPVVEWPATRQELSPGRTYDVELLGASGDAIRTFRIMPRRRDAGPVLLHVD